MFCTQICNETGFIQNTFVPRQFFFSEVICIESDFAQMLCWVTFCSDFFTASAFVQKLYLDRFFSEFVSIESCYCRCYFHSFKLGTEAICFEWGFCRNYWYCLRFLYRSYFYWVRFVYRRYVFWVRFRTECICIESCLHSLFF